MSWRRRYCLGSRKRWRTQCESDIKRMPYPQKIRSSASRFTAHTHWHYYTLGYNLVSHASPHSLLSPPPKNSHLPSLSSSHAHRQTLIHTPQYNISNILERHGWVAR